MIGVCSAQRPPLRRSPNRDVSARFLALHALRRKNGMISLVNYSKFRRLERLGSKRDVLARSMEDDSYSKIGHFGRSRSTKARHQNHDFALDIRHHFSYRPPNLAPVKDVSRVTPAGGARAVPAGGGSSPPLPGGSGSYARPAR